ncbi:MAG TPA: AIR synthase family protein [Thermomicrobiaceae bacterium]|nr:AIR synthase family protein [Thermomicrobiaceae bacterium]
MRQVAHDNPDGAPLPLGKLPAELLARLLARVPLSPDVILPAGIGRDAAAVRVGEQALVLKTDPVTFATDAIGWYAVNVGANDIACLGAAPRWMLATVLLPEGGASPALAERILDDLLSACRALGVSLVGGHTEITAGLDRPIVVGMLAGLTDPASLIDPRRARPGDAILLANGIAIEGTALLARELAGPLTERFGADFVARCREFLYRPGISVVDAAGVLHQALGQEVHALHDPTEGGLATGLRELAAAIDGGLLVDENAIFVYPETRVICRALGLDPLGLIASGALLAVVDPAAREPALAALRAAGINAAALGSLTAEAGQLLLRRDGREEPLPAFAVDELARYLASERGTH